MMRDSCFPTDCVFLSTSRGSLVVSPDHGTYCAVLPDEREAMKAWIDDKADALPEPLHTRLKAHGFLTKRVRFVHTIDFSSSRSRMRVTCVVPIAAPILAVRVKTRSRWMTSSVSSMKPQHSIPIFSSRSPAGSRSSSPGSLTPSNMRPRTPKLPSAY